jgi:hypothetical protein
MVPISMPFVPGVSLIFEGAKEGGITIFELEKWGLGKKSFEMKC